MLIGICGKAGSGKDTVADYLYSNHRFAKISLATPLKDILKDLFYLSDEQVNGKLKEVIDERYGKTPRWMMQHLGTDVFRSLYPDIWATKAIRKYLSIRGSCDAVISDVRFLNEYTAIIANNGYIWKVVREGHEGAKTGIAEHPSEHDLDKLMDSSYDSVLIAGTGELSKLFSQADQALERIKEREYAKRRL